MPELKMTIGGVTIRVELLDTPTAQEIVEALPIHGRASLWGKEIHFETPVTALREPDARDVVEVGEIAYTPGNDFIVVAYGPTPMSKGDEIKLAKPSNIWGRALDDVAALEEVGNGAPVLIEAG